MGDASNVKRFGPFAFTCALVALDGITADGFEAALRDWLIVPLFKPQPQWRQIDRERQA
jgi:hypothetical protein